MISTYRKGARLERRLKHLLEAHGIAVIRAAGSGNNSPDLALIRAGRVVFVEVKYGKRYVDIKKLTDYFNWRVKTGAPLLFITWIQKKGWVLEDILDLRRTETGAVIGDHPPVSAQDLVERLLAYFPETP